MSITHHPPADILGDFTSGALSEAEHLVVAVHLATCTACQRFVRMMGQLTGAALADATAPAAPGAFEVIMVGIDHRAKSVAADAPPRPTDPELAVLPEPLQRCEIGTRRWLAPGLTTWPIALAPAGRSRAFLLHGQPGTKLIQHSHTGNELTCVLKGSYTDQNGRYQTGDMDFADDDVAHELRVSDDGPCLCIIAMTGEFKISGMLGWLLTPFIRL